MRRHIIDMLIDNLIYLRTGHVLSDKAKDIKYVEEIDRIIEELQKMKVNELKN